MSLYYKEIDSPVGMLKIIANDDAIVGMLWKAEPMENLNGEELTFAPRHAILMQAERQLKEYFAGKRKTFDLPLEPMGTPFQQKVWAALCKIPFGTTESYGGLARSIGKPKACRAVGAANGRNPIGIIIPCHRVIGANGDLTGFGGGLDIKEILLKLEGSL